MVNGTYREAFPWAYVRTVNGQDFLGIVGDYLGPLYEVRESIGLINVPIEPGVTQLGVNRNDSLPYVLYSFLDYDVILGHYLVEEGRTPKGFIDLEEYDPVTMEVKGTFECVVYNQSMTDSLVFTEGFFHTRLKR